VEAPFDSSASEYTELKTIVPGVVVVDCEIGGSGAGPIASGVDDAGSMRGGSRCSISKADESEESETRIQPGKKNSASTFVTLRSSSWENSRDSSDRRS
jgi:hypothetical protein